MNAILLLFLIAKYPDFRYAVHNTKCAKSRVRMNLRKREKGMYEKKLGPLLSDEQFFGECLNLDYQ